jgi:hypothetical protein
MFIEKNGKRKAFHKGGNSSCRQHIRQHYNLYVERCKEAKPEIPINHWAIPCTTWEAMEKEKEEKQGQLTKKGRQQTLDFATVTGPREFTRAGTLHAVATLIATNNQVSDLLPIYNSKKNSPFTHSPSLSPTTWHSKIALPP